MHGHDHVGRTAGQRQVGHARVLGGQPVGIVAALFRVRPLLRVANHRPRGVVELQVAAAGVVEGADRLLIGEPDVVEIGVDVRIDLLADGLAALAEMQGRRRRDRHLRRHLGVVLDEAEMVEMRVAGKADLADDAHALGLGLHPGKGDALAGGIELSAVELFVEIELPPGTPELAVGRELEPDLLLLLDGLLDLAVLDCLELVGGDLALPMLGARLLERRRTQQAPDVIGAERGLGSRCHDFTCPRLRRQAR